MILSEIIILQAATALMVSIILQENKFVQIVLFNALLATILLMSVFNVNQLFIDYLLRHASV
jgi:hypothetical protein